uniref:Uncharacterized protein n=1 Tax=Rhizophora mucronata TaxID=61149 RepID=A0A2P2NUZ1_RHIMU
MQLENNYLTEPSILLFGCSHALNSIVFILHGTTFNDLNMAHAMCLYFL